MRALKLLALCSVVYAQSDKINFVAPGPPGVNPRSVRYTINGPRGSRYVYYWVVAKYARGNVVNPYPVRVYGAPNTYSETNSVTVTWDSAPGVTGYDLLRTTSTSLSFGEDCSCAVATNLLTTTYTDTTEGPLGSYTPTTVTGASGFIQLNNQDFSSPTWVFEPPLAGGGGGAVSSVFGRTGAVTAQVGDYTAAQVANTPAGNISAVNVQSAINELDSEKAPTNHTHAASAITSGVLPVSRGGTNLSSLVGGRCIQSRVDGTGFEETSGACGTGGGGGGAYSQDFASSTTWSVAGSTHGLATCDLAVEIWVDDGAGQRQTTFGFSAIKCEPDAGPTQFDVTVSWPVATAGRLTLLKSGGSSGGGSAPGGTPGQLQYNAGGGSFGGVPSSGVSGSQVTLSDLVVTTTFSGPQGASLPATCSVGQRFFLTSATAGRNLYGCTSTNTWTLLGDGGGGGGGSFDPAADYDLSGNNIVNASVITVRKGNDSTGTTQYRLACIQGTGLVATCTTANASRTIGPCYANCGTTGSARIAIAGSNISCQFDGSVTAGNWVAPSTTQAGMCTDAGTTRPATALGILNETGSGASVYTFTKGVL